MAGRKVQKARQIDIVRASTEALKSYIANEGKRLNRQITMIEKNNLTGASFGYKKLIETSANRKFLGVTKPDRTGATHTKIELSTRGKTHQELQQLASLIQRTAGYKTITKSGIKQYYGRVFDKLRAKYPGLDKFTDEQLSDILTTMGFESAKGFDGSDRLFRLIAKGEDVDSVVSYIEKTNGFEDIQQANREYGYVMGRITKEQRDDKSFFYNPFEE